MYAPSEHADRRAALSLMPDDVYIVKPEVAQLMSCSDRHIERLCKNDPTFPKGRLLLRLRRWRIGDVREWMRRAQA